jgi:hypothetical protein
MKKKLHWVRNTVSLTCHWEPTGNPRIPLTRVWSGAKAPEAAKTASSSDETGRMHLCA